MTQAQKSSTAVVKYDGGKPIRSMEESHDGKVVRLGVPAFADWLMSRKSSISSVAARHMNPEKTIKVVLNNFDKNPALMNCTGNSIWRCVMQSVELGLEPGGALGLAHLVPYKEQCTLVIDYKGLEVLAYRNPAVKSIVHGAVYEGDEFTYVKYPFELRHVPCGEDDPSKITHTYCICELASGGVLHSVLTRKQVERLRGFSAGRNSTPWTAHYEAMAIKTAIRQCLKHAPKSTEEDALAKALALDDRNDIAGSAPVFDFEVMEDGETVAVPQSKSSRMAAQLTTDAPPVLPNPYDG